MHVSMKVSVFRRGSYVARVIACAELLGVAQLRQKLTNDCAHTMKRHGACLLQRSGRKSPSTLTH